MFSPEAVTQVFNPLVAAYRDEYRTALCSQDRWRMHTIRVRCAVAFLDAAMFTPVLRLISRVAKALKGGA
jgi:hypothetical protein